MKNEKSERKFDFRPMGLAIKKAREKKGMTQEQLADIIGRDTRTVIQPLMIELIRPYVKHIFRFR